MIEQPKINKDGIAIWTKEHRKAWRNVKITKSKEAFGKFLETMNHCPNMICSFKLEKNFSKEGCKKCGLLFSYFLDKQRGDVLGWKYSI